MTQTDLAPLERALGYPFGDRDPLVRALSHRSYCSEHPDRRSNERLEFLGDSVLGLVVTDHIFSEYPELPEGELAKVRAVIVSATTLADVASGLDLGDYLYLGRGEEQSGGREKSSILADAMEAVIGAVYIDGGWEPARDLVLTLLGERIAEGAKGPGIHDYKTRLQELAAQTLDVVPRYVVESEGPDHAKEFRATVYLLGEARGVGEGTSKKQAEQIAAAEAWEALAEEQRVQAHQGAEETTPEAVSSEQGSGNA